MTNTPFLPLDARVVLLLSLSGLLRPVRMIAKVVWVQRQRFSEGFDCGLQFIEISSEDQDTITGYLDRG